MPSVFISYSREDDGFAQTLKKALKDQEIDVKIAKKTFDEIDNSEADIKQAIKETDYTILVVSKNSLHSDRIISGEFMDQVVNFQRQCEEIQRKIEAGDFDVFLCHNSQDKPEVKALGERLKEAGIRPWLDEWEFRPGLPWQKTLENQISQIKSAAVFIGSKGIGPWQDMEIDAFLRIFVKRQSPVIPVLLSGCEDAPKLPLFLEGMMWVDFRKNEPDPFDQLIWGITGKKREMQLYEKLLNQKKLIPIAIDDSVFHLNIFSESQNKAVKPLLKYLKAYQLDFRQKEKREEFDKNLHELVEIIKGNIGIEDRNLPSSSTLPVCRCLTPLPEPPVYFKDRESNSDCVRKFLQNKNQHVMTLHGRCEIGKKTLLAWLCEELKKNSLLDDSGAEIQLDIFYHYIATNQDIAEEIYTELKKNISSEFQEGLNKTISTEKNPSLRKLDKILQGFTKSPGNRWILLLLDHVEEIFKENGEEAIEIFRKALILIAKKPGHRVKVIINRENEPTELNELSSKEHIEEHVEQLEKKWVKEVLLAMDKQQKDRKLQELSDEELDSEVDAIYSHLGGIPRALEVLYDQSHDKRLAETLDSILTTPNRYTKEQNFEKLLGYRFKQFDENTQRVLQALAIFYGLPVPEDALNELLKPYQETFDIEQVLNKLENLRLVHNDKEGYRLDCPLDRDFALNSLREDKKIELYRCGTRYFEKDFDKENYKTIKDLSPQLAAFDLCCKGKDYDKAAKILLEFDRKYLIAWGYYRKAFGLHEKLENKINDDLLKGKHLLHWGRAYSELGRNLEAIKITRRALTIFEEIDNKNEQGESYAYLGMYHDAQGYPFKKSCEYYEEAYKIFESIPCYPNMCKTLIQRGEICFDNNKPFEQTIKFFNDAIEIAQTYDSMEPQLITIYSNLAFMYLYNEKFDEASNYLKKLEDLEDDEYQYHTFNLRGIIAFRDEVSLQAQKYFKKAIKCSEKVLQTDEDEENENSYAFGNKGFALAGLALCSHQNIENYNKYIQEAIASYTIACSINSSPGFVRQIEQMLKMLDPGHILPSQLYNVIERQSQ